MPNTSKNTVVIRFLIVLENTFSSFTFQHYFASSNDQVVNDGTWKNTTKNMQWWNEKKWTRHPFEKWIFKVIQCDNFVYRTIWIRLNSNFATIIVSIVCPIFSSQFLMQKEISWLALLNIPTKIDIAVLCSAKKMIRFLRRKSLRMISNVWWKKKSLESFWKEIEIE